jgi:hypothetical protein
MLLLQVGDAATSETGIRVIDDGFICYLLESQRLLLTL